ncbi:metal ABC transporter substrate-binding protein [Corynebacterium durum]|uniref:metal ABC transporter substrate-binding protein n=1 Tax=Corynebacterium durum TaxID=61592 RepID=UPI000684CA77|nr:metal ABC transporter substrate-binding protein [Corynebacterium durum]
MKSRQPWAVVLGAVAASSLLLAGCSSSTGEKSDGLNVVATTTQLCDYVTQIGRAAAEKEDSLSFTKVDAAGTSTTVGGDSGTRASTLNLTCLLAPNASAHSHEMTVNQMKALSSADLFLVNGVDLEHFLDDAVSSSGFHGTMVVSSGVASANNAKAKDAAYTLDEGDEKVQVAPWPFPPEHGDTPEFQYDPHVWTSPANAAIQVHNIGAALADKQPVLKPYVTEYENRLTKLDDWARQSLESVPKDSRVLFTSHDAFGYFSHNYDVTFIGAALSDFNEQQDATAEHIRAAADEVKKSGAKALFAENSNNSKSIEAIAQAAGVKAIVGDDALYGDSLGPEGSPGETYVGSIVHNVSTLVDAWGGTPAELPADLH